MSETEPGGIGTVEVQIPSKESKYHDALRLEKAPKGVITLIEQLQERRRRLIEKKQELIKALQEAGAGKKAGCCEQKD